MKYPDNSYICNRMTSLQSRHTGFWLHLAAWSVVFGLPLFVPGGREPVMNMQEYVRFLVVPLSFMAVFYVNYLLLIDRYLFTRHVGRFLLANALLVAGVMLLVHLFFRFGVPPRPHHPPMERPWQDTMFFFLRNAMLYLLVVGVSVAIRMTGQWYRAENIRKDLERSRSEAELQNLKSQLNPHFLFNTLNNIYSLIQLDPDRAQQTVHDLSRLLRYVLYDSSRPTVPLKAEMDFLGNYIELMRIRLPRHVRLDVSLPENPSHTLVAPLLFISLVENAFKHGVSNDRPSFIDIDIREEEGVLACRIENSFFPKSEADRSGSGIGLANLCRRLEMIYPGRYEMKYGQHGDTYETLLRINLTDR